MKTMKKVVLAGLVLLASMMVLVGCKNDSVPEIHVSCDCHGTSSSPEVMMPQCYRFPAGVKSLPNYVSPNHTDNSWTYVEFGWWPQTRVTVKEGTLEQVPAGRGMFNKDNYYTDNAGHYFVKLDTSYYLVEPIRWRILNKDFAKTGRALLLAENILDVVKCYENKESRNIPDGGTTKAEPDTVYANNYKYSSIRGWLNGKYESGYALAETFKDNGFLQTAFTKEEQNLIVETLVDNSEESTNPATNSSTYNGGLNQYACVDTTEKIFLLSVQEATTLGYGFADYNVSLNEAKGSTRTRSPTDYAKDKRAFSSDKGFGSWWLRSPYYLREYDMLSVSNNGAVSSTRVVTETGVGVVPALYIKLQ